MRWFQPFVWVWRAGGFPRRPIFYLLDHSGSGWRKEKSRSGSVFVTHNRCPHRYFLLDDHWLLQTLHVHPLPPLLPSTQLGLSIQDLPVKCDALHSKDFPRILVSGKDQVGVAQCHRRKACSQRRASQCYPWGHSLSTHVCQSRLYRQGRTVRALVDFSYHNAIFILDCICSLVSFVCILSSPPCHFGHLSLPMQSH